MNVIFWLVYIIEKFMQLFLAYLLFSTLSNIKLKRLISSKIHFITFPFNSKPYPLMDQYRYSIKDCAIALQFKLFSLD